MGQLLKKEPKKPYDRDLLRNLKEKSLGDLNECIEIINEEYADCPYLTYEQFEDIFCGMLNNTEPYFLQLQNDQDIAKTVDMFESVASFTVFCGDKFEDKLMYIFRLFDFDRSTTIEKNELVLTLQSAVRAICKFVNIDPPTVKECEEAADNIFILIDHDNNKKISLKEFTFWVTNNPELQEFLLRYAGTQTFENLEKRFTQLRVFYKYLFDRCGDHDSQCVAVDDLRALFDQECKNSLTKDKVDYLFNVFVATSNQTLGPQNNKLRLIDRSAYTQIIRAWCAFSAADINNDDTLTTKELNNLIWIYEDKEADPIRIQQEMKDMDKDNSGFVSRIEWMKNFCSVDENTGRAVFRGQLFKLFDQYDQDNSGYLSKDEITLLIQDQFKEYVRLVEKTGDEAKIKNVKDMLESLRDQIIEELDQEKDGAISWEEFKRFMEASLEKQSKLKEFLDKFVMQK